MKSGENFGKWTLKGDRELGKGGNSIVWCAQGPSYPNVAIKFLTRYDRYSRFCDEVQFQRQKSSRPGILPLLDFNLPDSPSKKDRPWLVTPLAIGIRQFIDQSTNDVVVRAVKSVWDVAKTLIEFHSENAAHRDIKPENIFIYKKRVVLGDFGLITYPGKHATTMPGERLGPIYYVAPELLGNQDEVQDCRPGDVYSLAKTLWVLASGQRFPLPGNLVATENICRLSSYVSHERAILLDRLIELSTVINPAKRPTCYEFAEELEAWLEGKGNIDSSTSISSSTSTRLRQLAEIADCGRREREMADREATYLLSYLHRQLTEMGCQLAEVAGIPPRSGRLPNGDTNIALRYFPYKTNENCTGVGNRCFEEHFTTKDGKIVVVNGSAVLERTSDTYGVLKGGLVIASNHRPTEFVFETEHSFAFGSAKQQTSVGQFLEELREHIPILAERIIEILNAENEP